MTAPRLRSIRASAEERARLAEARDQVLLDEIVARAAGVAYRAVFASVEVRVVIGWDKEDVEAAGLIKTDLLCIRALSLIHEAVELVAGQTGDRPNLAALPLDDPSLYRQLQTADTIGTFYVQSRAPGQVLPKTRPSCF